MIAPSNIRHVLLGGAAGDCIGLPHEGNPDPAEPYEPPGNWRLSDDTVLTLATCKAILQGGEAEPASIAKELLAAYRRGPIRGLGASTLKALRDLDAGIHWALSGRGGEYAAGNGAAMRIAPLAFVLSGEDSVDRRIIRDVCRITHKNDEAYVAALAVIRGMHLLADIDQPAQFMSTLARELPDTKVRDTIIALSELAGDASLQDVSKTTGTSGHAPESVPLALYMAARFRDSKTAILASIQCGGDTDTIASIAGQLCGAIGSAIPEAWRLSIPDVEDICELADSLVAMLLQRSSTN